VEVNPNRFVLRSFKRGQHSQQIDSEICHLTLCVRQEGLPAHINPVVVPVSLTFVRAPAHPGYPGSKGHKAVVLYVHGTT